MIHMRMISEPPDEAMIFDQTGHAFSQSGALALIELPLSLREATSLSIILHKRQREKYFC